jgi:hypothetical protein
VTPRTRKIYCICRCCRCSAARSPLPSSACVSFAPRPSSPTAVRPNSCKSFYFRVPKCLNVVPGLRFRASACAPKLRGRYLSHLPQHFLVHLGGLQIEGLIEGESCVPGEHFFKLFLQDRLQVFLLFAILVRGCLWKFLIHNVSDIVCFIIKNLYYHYITTHFIN